MLIRIGLMGFAVLAFACSSDVVFDGTGGGGGATSRSVTTTTSASGGSGGSTATSAAGGSGGTVTCNPNGVMCDGPAPNCEPGKVPSVDGGCWGDCVPILECATEPNCDNCTNGFCAEYVAHTVEYRCVLPTLMCSALLCTCVAPYFCVTPFDACVDSTGPADVSCGCPTC